MTPLDAAQRLAARVQAVLGNGPFLPPRGWTHMGAVICDASFQARRKYVTLRPRLLRLQATWPDAFTVRGFQARLATDDLAAAMDFKSPGRVAIAQGITDLLAASEVDSRDDLRAWLGSQEHRALLRTVVGVGPKTVDYIGNLVGRSQVAVDVHLRAFAAAAGVVGLPYEQLQAAYEGAAAILGDECAGLEHAVWRLKSQAG